MPSQSGAKDESSIHHRLGECLQRMVDAETILANTRETLKELCTETASMNGNAAPAPPIRQMNDAGSVSPLSRQNSRLANGDRASEDIDDIKAKTQANDGALVDKSFEHRIRKKGVYQSKVLRYLRKEKDESDACMQLPAATLLVIVFCLMTHSHFHLDILHSVDTAMTFDIIENANFAFSGIIPFENGRMGHKNIYDVNSIPDFWSLMELGIAPLWWPIQDNFGFSESRLNIISGCTGPKSALRSYAYTDATIGHLPDTPIEYGAAGGSCPTGILNDTFTFPSEVLDLKVVGTNVDRLTPTYLYFNSIVGGARLSQQKTGIGECRAEGKDRLYGVHSGRCVWWEGWWLMPEIHQSLDVNQPLLDKPGGETVYLLSGKHQTEIIGELRALEERAWFNPQTSKIEVMFTTYNAHQDLLTATFLLFFFNRAGHIHKIVEPVSIFLDPYFNHDPACYVLDIIWILLLIKIFLEEGFEMVKTISQLGFANGIKEYFDFSNFIDWLNIGYSIVLIGMWIMQILNCQVIQKLLARGNVEILGTWTDDADREKWFKVTHDAVRHQQALRTVLAVYPFVIVSRFFKAFNSQPRLSIVTRTLSKASVRIIHFAVVFLCVFNIFVISAWLLFGQEIKYFANYARSFHSTFRIMIGDFDWEILHQVGRPQAYAWFWTLQWLLNMIMLNMLLAIIMDVYGAVSSEILAQYHIETLWSQAYEIIVRSWGVRTGKLVGLNKILHILDPTDLDEDDEPEEEVLFLKTFQEKIPGLSETQAVEIMMEAEMLSELMPDSMEEAKSSILMVHEEVQGLRSSVDEALRSLAAQRQRGSQGWVGCISPFVSSSAAGQYEFKI